MSVTLTDLVYFQEVLIEMIGILATKQQRSPKRVMNVLNPLLRIMDHVQTSTKLGKI
ncbi:MAG: hypothetical protein JSV15_04440 [Candidatus Bathyarchaeota archaeon]|nr:MAG: hypothetical protein JSV15_04440 [Candidatus Bathyarchaeota archaeon]